MWGHQCVGWGFEVISNFVSFRLNDDSFCEVKFDFFFVFLLYFISTLTIFLP